MSTLKPFARPLIALAAVASLSACATAPMGRLAAELYNRFVADGHAGKDFSEIITTLREDSREG